MNFYEVWHSVAEGEPGPAFNSGDNCRLQEHRSRVISIPPKRKRRASPKQGAIPGARIPRNLALLRKVFAL